MEGGAKAKTTASSIAANCRRKLARMALLPVFKCHIGRGAVGSGPLHSHAPNRDPVGDSRGVTDDFVHFRGDFSGPLKGGGIGKLDEDKHLMTETAAWLNRGLCSLFHLNGNAVK